MTRKESDVQRAILDYLKLRGIFAYRMKNEGTFDPTCHVWRKGTGTPGLPDIGGVLPGGRALFIEVKRPGQRRKDGKFKSGVITDYQKMFIAKAKMAGAVAFVADSVEAVEGGIREADDA
jgi:hypothetical protein